MIYAILVIAILASLTIARKLRQNPKSGLVIFRGPTAAQLKAVERIKARKW